MNEKELIELGEVAFYRFKHSAGFDYKSIGRILIGHIDRMGYQVTKKPEPWNGEGLPPVGTECLVIWRASGNNEESVITYMGDGVGCYQPLKNDSREFSFSVDCVEFRPVRTEKEKLVEQAKELLPLSVANGESFENFAYRIVNRLVNAGWRPAEGNDNG